MKKELCLAATLRLPVTGQLARTDKDYQSDSSGGTIILTWKICDGSVLAFNPIIWNL